MKDDQHIIRRSPHIDLHKVDFKSDPLLNSDQGVFRSVARSPAMAPYLNTCRIIFTARNCRDTGSRGYSIGGASRRLWASKLAR